MPLTTVVASNRTLSSLPTVMAPDRQDSIVDDVVVRAVEPRPPLFQACEQAPERGFVTFSAFPVDQSVLRPVIGFPDPDPVRLALQIVPHLVNLDDRRWIDRLDLRLRAVPVTVGANPPHDRLGTTPEQATDGIERQTELVQRDRRLLHLIGCAIAVRARELVSAAPTQPPLLAPRMSGLHHPNAAAARAKRTIFHSASLRLPICSANM